MKYLYQFYNFCCFQINYVFSIDFKLKKNLQHMQFFLNIHFVYKYILYPIKYSFVNIYNDLV